MIRKSMPSDLIRGWVPVFPRDKREAFARRSCSNKKIERDDDSKKSHPALGSLEVLLRRDQESDRLAGEAPDIIQADIIRVPGLGTCRYRQAPFPRSCAMPGVQRGQNRDWLQDPSRNCACSPARR